MDAAPLRIMIVDDSVDSARMLRVLLKAEGHQVRIEFDGQAALACAAHFLPQVALLDLTLPGMSGIEVATEMRRVPELAGCRLVSVSGHGKDSLPSPSPFTQHFQKPIDQESLLAYLESIPSGREPLFEETDAA